MTSPNSGKKRLIVECGVAQTRAALIADDKVKRFWFGPARGDESQDHAPRAGRRYAARVKSINISLKAAFVDLGDERDAYLALNKKIEPYIHDGALVGVVVKSPPRQGKGAVVKHRADANINCDKPGRIEPIPDAVFEAISTVGADADEIVVDDGAVAMMLKAKGVRADIIHETHARVLFEAFDVENVLENAFERIAPLSGGGRLVIDEAQALTAIDVDTLGLSAASPARLREKIAVAAAHEAMRQICLRDISGHVVIDFPSMKSDTARLRFKEQLQTAMAGVQGASAFSFSKSGLFSFTVPHKVQTLLERFTEETTDTPAPGRRFTLDWKGQSAIRKLEHSLRAAPSVRFHLRLGGAVFNYINRREEWLERLRDRYSARFELIEDETLMERDFELSEQ